MCAFSWLLIFAILCWLYLHGKKSERLLGAETSLGAFASFLAKLLTASFTMHRIMQWLFLWWRSVVNGQQSVVLSCTVTLNNYSDIIFLLNPMEGKFCHVKLTPHIPILVDCVVWFPRDKVSSNAWELTFACFCWAVFTGSMPCFLYLLSPLDSAGILLHLSERRPVVNSSKGSILCFDYHEPYPTGFTFWTTQRDLWEALFHTSADSKQEEHHRGKPLSISLEHGFYF